MARNTGIPDRRRVLVPLCTTVAAIFAAEINMPASESPSVLAAAKYQNLFEHALCGIYQSTPDGRFVSANERMARMLGYDSADAVLHPLADAAKELHPGSPGGRAEFLKLLVAGADPVVREFEILRQDGSRV